SEFTGLTDLSLSSPTHRRMLTNDQLTSVADLAKLESLSIDDPVVDDSGIAHLAGLKHLKMLDIRESKITDVGMASIGKLESLERLMVTGLMTDRGLDE